MPILLLSLLLTLCLSVLHAAELRFSHLGLEQGGVQVITQDKHGFMWLGTSSGLVRYDGHAVTSFRHDPDSLTSLQADNVIALHVSRNGHLWVGTAENGASYYDNKAGHFTRLEPAIIGRHVYRFHETASGEGVYAQTAKGLFFIDPNHTAELVLSAQYSESVLGLYFSDSNTHAMLETGQQLTLSKDPDKPVVSTFIKKNLIQFWKTSFCPQLVRESVMAGGGAGVFYCLKDGKATDANINKVLFMNGINLAQLQVFDLTDDSNGAIWISSDRGLLRITDDQLSVIKSAGFNGEALSGNALSTLFIGDNNTLFVGTQQQGLSILNQSEPGIKYVKALGTNIQTQCQIDDKKQIAPIWATLQDDKNGLWLGSEAGLTYHGHDSIQLSTLKALSNKESDITLCHIQAIEQVAEKVWIGTSEGLFNYDKQNQKLSRYLSQPSNDKGDHDLLTGNAISTLKYDSQRNQLWVGTHAGLLRIDLVSNHVTVSLVGERILSIHLDHSNRLWLGTRQGLSLWKEEQNVFKTFHAADQADTLSDPSVFTIHQTEPHKLWLGTGNGLNLFDSRRYVVEKRWFERDGLPSSVIYRLQTDEYGFYWLSTSNGVSRFDPKNNRFRNFYPQHDALWNVTEKTVFANHKKHLLYLAEVGGLSIIDPQAFVENDKPFPAVISKVALSNPEDGLTRLASVLSLAGGSHALARDVRLNYTFPFFGDSGLIKSQFRLLPGSNQWSENLSASGFADFRNLKPGSYEFQVKNNHSAEHISSYRFAIQPYLWETRWFQAVMWFCVILLSAVLFNYAYQLLRKFSAERVSRQHYRIVEHELRPHLHEANRHLEALMDSPDITDSDQQRIRSSVLPLVGKSIDFIAELRSLVDFKGEVEQPKKLYMLEDVLDEVLLFFKDQQHQITVQEVDDINILTHKDAVYLLVKNLISNAIKYSPGGEPVGVSALSKGDVLIVKCIDQGIGISKENRKAIYEPYKRFADEYKNIDGQGIGLAIVRYIVHTYHGDIAVKDNSPKGSCFTVRLRGVVVNG